MCEKTASLLKLSFKRARFLVESDCLSRQARDGRSGNLKLATVSCNRKQGETLALPGGYNTAGELTQEPSEILCVVALLSCLLSRACLGK